MKEYTGPQNKKSYLDWMKKEYPQPFALGYTPGAICYDNKGKQWYLIGYAGQDMLYLSTYDPSIDYENAVKTKKIVCLDCMDHAKTIPQPQKWNGYD